MKLPIPAFATNLVGKLYKVMSNTSVDVNNPNVWTTSDSSFAESSAGIQVSQGKSFTTSAYYACINAISQDIASLPRKIFNHPPGEFPEERERHPLISILNRAPNSRMNAYTYWQAVITYILAWGNSTSVISQDAFTGRPLGLIPVEPWRMEYRIDNDSGDIIYIVHPEPQTSQGIRVYSSDQVLHFRGMGIGKLGYSILEFQRNSLGRVLQTQDFINSYFKGGAHPGHVVQSKKVLSKPAKDRLERALEEFKAKAKWAKVMWLEDGVNVEPFEQHVLRDMQFIEQMQFGVEDIARWFRMPLRMLQYPKAQGEVDAHEVDIQYAKYTLKPIAVNIEQELNLKLLKTQPRLKVEHDFNDLNRPDPKSRAELYNKLFLSGSIKPNEIRARENLPPLPGQEGNKTYAQIQLAPLSDIVEMAKTSGNPPINRGRSNGLPKELPDDEELPAEGQAAKRKQHRIRMAMKPVIRQSCFDIGHRLFKTYDSICKESDAELRDHKINSLLESTRETAKTKFAVISICLNLPNDIADRFVNNCTMFYDPETWTGLHQRLFSELDKFYKEAIDEQDTNQA